MALPSFQLPLQLRQSRPAALLLLRLAQPGVDGFQLLVHVVQLLLQGGGAGPVLLQRRRNQGGGLLHGQLPRLGQVQLGGQVAGFIPADARQILLQTLPGVGAPAVHGG